MKTVIGIKLKQARVDSGLTTTQLAELSGVNRSTIANVETGRRKFHLDENTLKWLSAIGINSDYLTGGAPDDCVKGICLNCGNEFKVVGRRTKYCTDGCRVTFRNAARKTARSGNGLAGINTSGSNQPTVTTPLRPGDLAEILKRALDTASEFRIPRYRPAIDYVELFRKWSVNE